MGWGRCLKATLQTRAPKNFRWCRWRAEQRVERAQTRERGPPSAPAEITIILYNETIFKDTNLIIGSTQLTLEQCLSKKRLLMLLSHVMMTNKFKLANVKGRTDNGAGTSFNLGLLLTPDMFSSLAVRLFENKWPQDLLKLSACL